MDGIGISDLMILVISISLFVEMPFWCLSRVCMSSSLIGLVLGLATVLSAGNGVPGWLAGWLPGTAGRSEVPSGADRSACVLKSCYRTSVGPYGSRSRVVGGCAAFDHGGCRAPFSLARSRRPYCRTTGHLPLIIAHTSTLYTQYSRTAYRYMYSNSYVTG